MFLQCQHRNLSWDRYGYLINIAQIYVHFCIISNLKDRWTIRLCLNPWVAKQSASQKESVCSRVRNDIIGDNPDNSERFSSA